MSLVVKYSESPVKLMENQKLVEIEFPETATEIIGLKTDNLTKIDVAKCSKDFISTVKSSYQDVTNNGGGSISIVTPPSKIEYTASVKLNKSFSSLTFGTTIESHTFEGGKGVITFGGDAISIGTRAFESCSGLTSITIPDSVTSIGYNAFYKCSGLTSITIPDSVTSIGEYAFFGCSGLTSVTIGNGVTSISQYAFQSCSGLTSVTIGNGVTSISQYAFRDCSGLTSVTIGNGVTSIGAYVFYGCTKLSSVIYKDTTYTSKSEITSVLKQNGVSISSSSFNQTNLS